MFRRHHLVFSPHASMTFVAIAAGTMRARRSKVCWAARRVISVESTGEPVFRQLDARRDAARAHFPSRRAPEAIKERERKAGDSWSGQRQLDGRSTFTSNIVARGTCSVQRQWGTKGIWTLLITAAPPEHGPNSRIQAVVDVGATVRSERMSVPRARALDASPALAAEVGP